MEVCKMSEKIVLGIDIGFGNNKVVIASNEKGILKQFSFPTVVGTVKRQELIDDPRIFDYDGNSYYVGEEALLLPSTSIVDVKDYKALEYFAPLFIYYVCNKEKINPDVIATGLSKAHIGQSQYFQEKISKFTVNGNEIINNNVYVLPQGAGAKITIDEYGDNFPTKNSEFLGDRSYVGADIGFNTLDMFQVIHGKVSPNLFEGVENSGIVKIAKQLIDLVKEKLGKDITFNEAKEILANNGLRIRGKTIDFTSEIKEFKKQYLEELMALVESKYGKILDKMENLYIIGGGSYIFKDEEDDFIKIPKKDNEYYNAIGFYLYARSKLASIK